MSGACIGEALLGRRLGKKAMLIGALAQSLPDIDGVAALWNSSSANLLAHRGFSHSILFCLLASTLLSFAFEKHFRRHRVGLARWMIFFSVQIMVHIFLDLFNTYGVGLLEPFSHVRLSFNALYVFDPLLTLPLLIACLALLVSGKSARRKPWWLMALAINTVYLGYCARNKIMITKEAARILSGNNIRYQRIFTTPAPFNNFLWYVVAEDSEGFYIGYRSVFDGSQGMDLQYFPRNDSLLPRVTNLEEFENLVRFSTGLFTLEQWHDTLVFNDLRFGRIMGWQGGKEGFVFHYFLGQPDESNRLVMQRGRFAGWNRQTARSMLRRIRGVIQSAAPVPYLPSILLRERLGFCRALPGNSRTIPEANTNRARTKGLHLFAGRPKRAGLFFDSTACLRFVTGSLLKTGTCRPRTTPPPGKILTEPLCH